MNTDIDKEVKEEMNILEKENVPKSTMVNTKLEIKHLKSFLIDNGLSDDIEGMPATTLGKYLRFYYFKLKRKDGQFFAPRTLIGKRAAIQRYLTSCEVDRSINIMEDREFIRANATLKAKVGEAVKGGQKIVKFPPIESPDLIVIGKYFTRETPELLQLEVWFNLSLKMGLRGRELHHQMKKDWIEIEEDSAGRTYASIKTNYLSKNVRASLCQSDFENLENARLHDYPSKDKCPIEALKTYLSLLPGESMYPKPSRLAKPNKPETWYCRKEVVCKDALGKFMKMHACS